MKKSLIAALLIPVSFAAFAQTDLVKNVERDLKGKKITNAEALQKIQPALTNPETATDVVAWMTAGKAGVGVYDDLFTQAAIGKEIDKNLGGTSLIDGVQYFIAALPFDSVPDEKGKIKAKNSKEIIKQLENHYNDLNNAAIWLWEAQNYPGAYQAWDLYLNLPSNPIVSAAKFPHQPDSTMSEIAYNQALAAWQADQLQDALNAFKKAMSLGYNKKSVYDYAIAVAYQLQDNNEVNYLAEQAYPLFGNEDPKYLQLMINTKIENKQYNEARAMLDDAIAAQPDNANLYFVLGILEENVNNNQAALEDYKKAVTLDPDMAQAQYYVGRAICNEAYAIDDEASKLSNEEYQNVRETKVNPMFKEAAVYLEKAYQLDPDNMHDALVYLRNVYYNVGDEDNLHRVESLE